MNNRPNPETNDLLDRASEALRQSPIPAGPSRELVASTIERLQMEIPSTDPPDLVRLAQRRNLMIRIAGLSTVLAASVLVALFVGSFFINARTSFAEMLAEVKKAESVTLTNRQKIGNAPTFEFKWYMQGQKFRMEMPGVFAYIWDMDEPTYLNLDLVRKIAKAHPANQEAREAFANPVQQLQKAKPEDAKLVSEDEIGGKKVDVYQVAKIDFLGGKGDGLMKIWVDRETKLPVKITVEGPGDNKGAGKMCLEFTDFQWNKRLDDKLFKIPEDFTFVGLQPPQGPGPVEEKEPKGKKD